MGRYALRIVWKDGHDTGLYDFGLLLELGDAANGADQLSDNVKKSGN